MKFWDGWIDQIMFPISTQLTTQLTSIKCCTGEYPTQGIPDSRQKSYFDIENSMNVLYNTWLKILLILKKNTDI